MILKSYEIKKINLKESKFILLYGKNNELKKDALNYFTNKKKIFNYLESEILENTNIFSESITTKSLFEEEKVIIIKRATDKILKTFAELDIEKLEDVSIYIDADNLEKKSKLRQFFEKEKKLICIPFYPDTPQVLSQIAYDYFKKRNVKISMNNINLIINKCNGDRETLLNELNKIEFFCKNKKSIAAESIAKLTNLIENHSVSELIDNCLLKNEKKLIMILNENNFNNEDCVLITRTFLNKLKKILKLSNEFQKNNNVDLTISTAKPPIFWKDKETIKQQIYKWKPENIKQLIYKLNEIELLIKKNINNSINLITDFILEQASSNSNN